MTYYLLKLLISAALIVIVSEVSKRSTALGGLLASLPLVSYLALIWLWIDTRDRGRIAALSTSIFWLVLPSLALFLVLPMLLKAKVSFLSSLAISTLVMFACYGAMLWLLPRVGIRL